MLNCWIVAFLFVYLVTCLLTFQIFNNSFMVYILICIYSIILQFHFLFYFHTLFLLFSSFLFVYVQFTENIQSFILFFGCVRLLFLQNFQLNFIKNALDENCLFKNIVSWQRFFFIIIKLQ